MIYREAKTEDIEKLSEIRLSVKENVLSNPQRITRQMYETYLNEIGKVWGCEIDGRVAGFSVASEKDASIWALFIDPEYEGRGIGKNLLRLAVDWLFDSGAERIRLSTAPGTRADRFYERQGWQRDGLTADGEAAFILNNREGVMWGESSELEEKSLFENITEHRN